MAKPRIIISDTDKEYVFPLQNKFIDEFFELINLEIITDADYFKQLFSVPQKADILIVSEELYNSELNRHEIGDIFLMSEQTGDAGASGGNVTPIYKYTGIKEILNKIKGKSAVLRDSHIGKEEKPQLIVVTSASGGAGKTTVAAGLAAFLSDNYKRVLYINAGWLQTFRYLLENQVPVSANELYSKILAGGKLTYDDYKYVLRKEKFNYFPPLKASLVSLGLNCSLFRDIALSARDSGNFDYVIVDADTGYDAETAMLISNADRVIIVTGQSEPSVIAANILVGNISDAGSEKFIFVCNDFCKDCRNALVSGAVTPAFTVSEYIDHIASENRLKISDLAASQGIGKIGYLII